MKKKRAAAKTVTLPLFYKQVGEILLKGHPEYSARTKDALLQQFAHEAFLFSMIPGEAIGGAKLKRQARLRKHPNPGTPMLPEKIYQVFDWAFASNGFFSGNLPAGEAGDSMRRFRSAVSSLVGLYMETALGLEKSAFQIGKDAGDDEIGRVLSHQYLRYFVVSLIMSSLGSVFKVPGATLKRELSRLGVDPSKTSLKDLRSQKNRVAFARAVEKDLTELYSKVDVIAALKKETLPAT